MSSTTYHTNAKPRGRRGSHGEASDKPARSRASSSASVKLSKTLSRNLDEVSVPRNSRPSSPAVYLYRQRTLDSKQSDPVVGASRHPTLSLKPEKSIPSQNEPETSSIPVSPVKAKAQGFQDVHQYEVHDTGRRSVSPSKAKKHVTVEPADIPTESAGLPPLQPMHFSPGLGRKTHSSKSLVSMQPTVAEETEDIASPKSRAMPPEPPVPAPLPVNSTSASVSRSSRQEDDAHDPLSTSNPSLRDTTRVTATRTPIPLPYEPQLPFPRNSSEIMQPDAMYNSPRTSRSSIHEAQLLARSSGSSIQEHLMAPTPQGPVVFMQPSLDQRLAESAERGVFSTASPAPAPEVTLLHDFIPQSQSPIGSPPLSPYIYQPMGSPPPQPLQYAQPYPYQYPLPFSGNFPPTFYPTPFTSPTMPFYAPGDIPRAGSAGAEDERTKLLEKVTNVLPDINRLLQYYSESQGLLSEKDSLVKQTETQHMEETARLRIELIACKEEYEKIIGEQAAENLRLKEELAEQAEKIMSLHDSAHALVRSDEKSAHLGSQREKLAEEVEVGRSMNERLVAEKKLLDDEIEGLRTQVQSEKTGRESLLNDKAVLGDQVQSLLSQLHDRTTLHESVQAESQKAHARDLTEKEAEHGRVLHEHKTAMSKVQLDLAGIILKHTQQKKDLDAEKAIRLEHERIIIEKSKELEDVLRSHATTLAEMRKYGEIREEQHTQEVNVQLQELARMTAQHADKISNMQQMHKKQELEAQQAAAGRLLETSGKYEQHKATLQAELATCQARIEKLESELQEKDTEHDHLKMELVNVQDEHEALKSKHELADKHHAELADGMLNLKNKQAEWHRESERMDQILQKLRQLTPNKYKNDEYL